MEKLVAAKTSDVVTSIGRFGGLDFRSVYSDFELELTTDNPATLLRHLRREGVDLDNIVTYRNWWLRG